MTQDPEALSDGTPSPPTCDPSGSATSSGNATDSGDVHLVEVGGRTLWLVGTAHVSQRSVDLVREVIERERPDAVCIELDAGRYEALSQAKRFEEQDLREVLRKKQLATLMLNLILASYQRRLGLKLGVAPGSELMEAARVAESLGIPTALCDRDVRITLRRAWQSISWWQRVKLVAELAASLFDSPEVSEEELARIRDQDVVTEVRIELGRMMPDLKRVLIDERDAYLAHEILETPGRRIVAVVGAGHIEGMKARLEREERTDLEAIKAIPPASPVWKVVGWSIPLVIVGSIVAIAFTQGPEAAGRMRSSGSSPTRSRAGSAPPRARASAHDRRGGAVGALHEPHAADRRGLRRGLRAALDDAAARLRLRQRRRRPGRPVPLVEEPSDAHLPRLRTLDPRQPDRDVHGRLRRTRQSGRGRRGGIDTRWRPCSRRCTTPSRCCCSPSCCSRAASSARSRGASGCQGSRARSSAAS
ncbi:MAG: TraB family protein [Myxococcota bacterium]